MPAMMDGVAEGVLCPKRPAQIQLGIALPGEAETAVKLNAPITGKGIRITRLSLRHPQRYLDQLREWRRRSSKKIEVLRERLKPLEDLGALDDSTDEQQ